MSGLAPTPSAAICGGKSNDRLAGGAGNDTLRGGVGNYTYAFGRGGNQDLIDNRNGAGNDVLEFGAGIAQNQLWWQHTGDDLVVSIIGTDDRLTIQGWYDSAANRIDAFTLADGSTLYASQVNQLVSAMAAFVPPAMGQTTLPTEQQAALDPWLSISWQNVQSAPSGQRQG